MTFFQMIDLMKSDIQLKQLWFLKNDSGFNRNIRVFIEPGTIAVLVYRYGHWVWQMKIPVIKQLLMILYMLAKFVVVVLFGIYIPKEFKMGRGFAIHNYGGIFIPRGVAGDNLIVFQGVTVGHLRGQSGRPPKLGSNVFLGTGATLLGDIEIGSNVCVGANSLVMNNVKDNVTMVGVPARVVSDASWIAEKLEGKGDHW